MAYWLCGGRASCWRMIGYINCTAGGFICQLINLTLCTMRGWHCTRLVFFCSTWSHILLCVLSDEHTPTDPHVDRWAPEAVISWMIQSQLARNCCSTVSSCRTDNRMDGRRVIPSGGRVTPGSALRRWSNSRRLDSAAKGGVVFII